MPASALAALAAAATASSCPTVVCRFGNGCQLPCYPAPLPDGSCPLQACSREVCNWNYQPVGFTDLCRQALFWLSEGPTTPPKPVPSAAPRITTAPSKPAAPSAAPAPGTAAPSGPPPPTGSPSQGPSEALRSIRGQPRPPQPPAKSGGSSHALTLGVISGVVGLVLLLVVAAAAMRRHWRIGQDPDAETGEGVSNEVVPMENPPSSPLRRRCEAVEPACTPAPLSCPPSPSPSRPQPNSPAVAVRRMPRLSSEQGTTEVFTFEMNSADAEVPSRGLSRGVSSSPKEGSAESSPGAAAPPDRPVPASPQPAPRGKEPAPMPGEKESAPLPGGEDEAVPSLERASTSSSDF
eukprot:TRINITY_DN2750_c0_g1_i1.p1 TRINITY_DN2750_c0_g1~~TRINITY_DN2750_c0_g1_i1.p1  ORF type:complete len:382 (+),score=82.86 TRINITY_DN2750_c0_g1_i1:99-1148(+)